MHLQSRNRSRSSLQLDGPNLNRRRITCNSPVIAILFGHADASGVVATDGWMLVAVSEFLVAEIAGPSGLASALPRPFAGPVNATGIGGAFGAVRTCPTHATPTRPRTTTTAVFSAASLRANR